MQFDALVRAWHRKTRRPAATVDVKVDESFFDPLPSHHDPNGQRTLSAHLPRHPHG